jgi:SAM-dependent methyltransferase
MRKGIRRLISRLAAAMHAELIGEIRGQHKQVLARATESDRKLASSTRAVEEQAARGARTQKRLERMVRELSQRQNEMRLMLLHANGARRSRTRGGARIPPTAAGLTQSATVPERPAPDIPAEVVLELSACPVCESRAYSDVCEYNKLLLLAPDLADDAHVYRYALCHACGVVFARRRPSGPRYRWLLERFEMAVGRKEDSTSARNLVLSSLPLSDSDRQTLRRQAARGVFVSDHLAVDPTDYVPALAADRLSNSAHVELLGSLLTLRAPRVLELRPRLGSIGAALKRLYSADVCGMPLFEGQQFLIRETYGLTVDHMLDYDDFTIPYTGDFDLVIANHMFTHAVRPRAFLSTVRQRLRPGGHVYLYNEPDERSYLEDGKSIFRSLNPFHLQAFDLASLVRTLRATGFEVTFVRREGKSFMALASRREGSSEWTPMSEADRDHRVSQYRLARDLAILRLPRDVRGGFASEWDAVVERAVTAGLVEVDDSGRFRIKAGQSTRLRNG